MQFLVYAAVVLASIFGVMLEMDVLVEPAHKLEQTASLPMSPPVARVPLGRTAVTPDTNAQAAMPPPGIRETTAAAPADETPAAPEANANKVTAPVAPVQTTAGAPATAPEATADAAPASACDLRACAQAYHSFRAQDCSYQPYQGPREPCTKGAAAEAPAAPAALNAQAEANATTGAHCDINACADAYVTFNPVDCTYQPSDGPRRICSK